MRNLSGSYDTQSDLVQEVQSELYVALDENYISLDEFNDVYEQARRTRAAVRGFINYLKKYEGLRTATLNP